MKVAYVTNCFPILYHTFIVNEILRILDEGLDVIIVSLLRERFIERETDNNLRRLGGRVWYLDAYLTGSSRQFIHLLIRYSGRIQRLSPTLHRVLGQRLLRPPEYQGFLDQYVDDLGWLRYGISPLAKALAREGVGLIHAGFGNRPATLAMAVSQLNDIPFTFTTHAYDLFVDFPYADKKIAKATRLFTISRYNKQHLVNTCGCDPQKVTVIRVPFNRAQCDRITSAEREKDLIVAACRLHPIKGLDYALEAVRRLLQKGRALRLTVVGDGPMDTYLAEKVKRLGIQDHVKFVGTLDNESTLALMARASVFLLPSVIGVDGDRDGIPTSLIEAMYLGTPAVSSKVSGIPELVDDGINGFLTEPGDVGAIADRLERLLSNDQLRKKMGEEAREKVKHRFYERESGGIIAQAWRSILGERGRTMH